MDQVPYEPSEEERKRYYVGLPSRPVLVARTSADRWEPRIQSGQFAYQEPKVLQTAGTKHAICPLFNDSEAFRNRIYESLKGLDWVAIDILRIGYEDQPDKRPVTLLVSVPPDSSKWRPAVDAALRCKVVLEEHQIFDVHCEIKESFLSSAALDSTAEDAEHPNALYLHKRLSGTAWCFDYNLLFSEYLGSSIASQNNPKVEGTKGLYLYVDSQASGESTAVALTCRHVAISIETDDGSIVDHRTSSSPHHPMIHPGNSALQNMTELAQSHLGFLGRHKQQKQKQDAIDGISRVITTLRNLRDPNSRVFGHVFYAPSYKLQRSKKDTWLSDWALIQLHQANHQTELNGEGLQNAIIGRINSTQVTTLEKWLTTNQGEGETAEIEDDKYTLKLSKEVIPVDEMKKPVTHMANGEPGLLVGKVGRTTQLTFGAANEIMSVIRVDSPVGKIETQEWCIISGSRKSAFSERGDSGACVWDPNGRIGGVLTSGAGISGIYDTAYATPMAWLLEHFEACGLKVSIP